MNRQLKLGLIGCGALGEAHARCVRKTERAAFVAYADTSRSAAERLLAKYGGRYATDDVNRVLQDPSIDAVYICTRHDSHAPLAVAAARAGKHVFIEKPLAMTIEECDAIARAVEAARVFLMPAFKLRYSPLIQKARQFIPRPQVLIGQVMDDRWPDDEWIQDPKEGGGNVLSQGCHMTDLLRYLAGAEPQCVGAVGGAMTHPGHPCIDQCAAAIKFANGSIASWISGDAATTPFTGKFFLQIFGDGRSVQIYDRFKQATFYDGRNTWVEQRPEEESLQLENEAFLKAVQEQRAPDITAHDGLQATRIILAADMAIRTGRIQWFNEFPPTGDGSREFESTISTSR